MAILSVHLCHVRSITIYFTVLMLWRIAVSYSDGKPIGDALEIDVWLAALLGIVMAIALTFAFLVARTTIYTVTTRRVALRYGIAFTKAVNVPLRLIKSAGTRCTPTARSMLRWPWPVRTRLPISSCGHMPGLGAFHRQSLCCEPFPNLSRWRML